MSKEKKSKFSFYEKENKNVAVFDKLCDRAKSIVFNSLEHISTMLYLSVLGIPEELAEISPIEQIFYVAKESLGLMYLDELKFQIYFTSQEYVEAKGKTYKPDFYVDSFCYKDEEYNFNKPILIELDGHDYHSTKEQRNYDYERENNLKLEGYHILRFTGSQVYNEPFECVEKVYQYAFQLIKKREFN